MKITTSNKTFFLLQGLYLSAYCSLCSFLVNMLRIYGFSSRECGIITTVQAIIMFAAQPLYGYVMDNILSAKKLLVTLLAGGILAVLPLPAVMGSKNFAATLIYCTVLWLFISAGNSVLDAWCIRVINKHGNMSYTLVRSGGSFFYAIAALVSGYLLPHFGVASNIYFHVAMCAVTIVLALFMEDAEPIKASKEGESDKPTFKEAWGKLSKNRPYMKFLLAVCFFSFGTRAAITFLPIVLESAGGTSFHFGISQFISALFEGMFMIWVSRFVGNMQHKGKILLIGFSVCTLRLACLVIFPYLPVMLATQLLQSVGYGLFLSGNVEYVSEIVPVKYYGLAISTASAVLNGVGSVIGNYSAGVLIDTVGVPLYVTISTVCMGIAAILCIEKRKTE